MAVTSQARARSSPGDVEPWNLFRLVRPPAARPDPRVLRSWSGAAACLGLFAALFRDNLWHFHYAWTTDENYSHGFLVPVISLYFANQAARGGPVPIRGGTWLGGLGLLVAIVARLFTIPLPIPFLGDLAFLIGLAGGFTLLFGAAAIRRCRRRAPTACACSARRPGLPCPR